MKRLSLLFATAAFLVSIPAWADKVAVLPFAAAKSLPRPELEQARQWTREAVTKKGHTPASDSEMVAAEATVRDGVADTRQEYVAAGKAIGAEWTLSARVERTDYPAENYAAYRVELEACQVASGRVESLSREVLPDEGADDVAEMLALLLRPEGIANTEVPWANAGVRKPKPKPKAPEPPPPPPPPPGPPPPPPHRFVYGEGAPFALGASLGVNDAFVRPGVGRGPTLAMPLGVVFGYALADVAPGVELKGQLTSQVVGPKALEVSAGARYAIAPIADTRFFIGPEVLLGVHAALGAEKTARFLAHGSVFAAYGFGPNVQLEIAADLAGAFGGAGTLVLGGGTARALFRF